MQDLNVDFREIDKFEELANRWWDPDREFKPLHDINPLRLDYIKQNTGGLLSGKRVLDVGCGGGILAESMALCGAQVTGIDMGKAPLAVACLHKLESGIDLDYRYTTAEELAESEPASFEIVTCMEMLEHVPDPALVIKSCARLLKPSGHLFLSTINRNVKAYLLAVIGAEYFLRLLPRGTHDYSKFIRPSEIGYWLRNAGLSLYSLIGIHYNPLLKSYWLGPGVSVNYLAHCRQEDLD
jgi:2-polyprenyl-6-hydroxyphenyl methylase / 3-demethylubiquinone-9 3-methyltransferase